MDTPFLKPNRPLGYGLWVNMHIFCHIEKKNDDDDDDVKKIEGMNYERKKIKTYIYLRVAWALSIVTLSWVASRLVRPRSKYLISNSTKGNISCGESIQKLHNTQEKKGDELWIMNVKRPCLWLISKRFESSHLLHQ